MAEGFELADELMFTGVGSVDAAGEVVRTEVVVGGGLGENVPDDHDQGVGRGHGAAMAVFRPPFMPNRRWNRRNWAPR